MRLVIAQLGYGLMILLVGLYRDGAMDEKLDETTVIDV